MLWGVYFFIKWLANANYKERYLYFLHGFTLEQQIYVLQGEFDVLSAYFYNKLLQQGGENV